MIDNHDIDNLLSSYELAKGAVDHIKPVENGYFQYPREISEFMELLSQEPWVNYDYKPSEVRNILDGIEEASFEQIRSALTGIMRNERFFNGAWRNHLKSDRIAKLIFRLRELVNA